MSQTDQRFNALSPHLAQLVRALVTQWREILHRARASAGPILIFGPTASGKSDLALRLSAEVGCCIVNADASQVWSNWQVLTARPGRAEIVRACHALYGHLPYNAAYSTGHWLREVRPLLTGSHRPIFVGGTGLYFKALTEGLAEIPETDPKLRLRANARRDAEGHEGMLNELDAETRSRIDPNNPMRIQRAWEVLQSTGRGLAGWQSNTPAPLVPLEDAMAIHVTAPRDWLNARIALRFDAMLAQGALREVASNAPFWDRDLLSMKVIGAPELHAFHQGDITLEGARERAVIATRQYAKRQRTWGRARMGSWMPWDPSAHDA